MGANHSKYGTRYELEPTHLKRSVSPVSGSDNSRFSSRNLTIVKLGSSNTHPHLKTRGSLGFTAPILGRILNEPNLTY
jgi:hypothetical protein